MFRGVQPRLLYSKTGWFVGELLGGQAKSPSTPDDKKETQTEFSDWQFDRVFPILDQTQLDEFVQRTNVPVKLDTGINDKLHGPNGIPKIDFDTQMAVVIVNLGSQSKPRIVTKV